MQAVVSYAKRDHSIRPTLYTVELQMCDVVVVSVLAKNLQP